MCTVQCVNCVVTSWKCLKPISAHVINDAIIAEPTPCGRPHTVHDLHALAERVHNIPVSFPQSQEAIRAGVGWVWERAVDVHVFSF